MNWRLAVDATCLRTYNYLKTLFDVSQTSMFFVFFKLQFFEIFASVCSLKLRKNIVVIGKNLINRRHFWVTTGLYIVYQLSNKYLNDRGPNDYKSKHDERSFDP